MMLQSHRHGRVDDAFAARLASCRRHCRYGRLDDVGDVDGH